MKKRTKTQEAIEYLREHKIDVDRADPHDKSAGYVATTNGTRIGSVPNDAAVRRMARATCLTDVVDEINRELGGGASFGLKNPNSWCATVEDAGGMKVDVGALLRGERGAVFDLRNPEPLKSTLLDAVRFGHAIANLGIPVKELRQTSECCWYIQRPLIWAPRRGFLQDWKELSVWYYSSPERTVVRKSTPWGAGDIVQEVDTWLSLDRLTKLIAFT